MVHTGPGPSFRAGLLIPGEPAVMESEVFGFGVVPAALVTAVADEGVEAAAGNSTSAFVAGDEDVGF